MQSAVCKNYAKEYIQKVMWRKKWIWLCEKRCMCIFNYACSWSQEERLTVWGLSYGIWECCSPNSAASFAVVVGMKQCDRSGSANSAPPFHYHSRTKWCPIAMRLTCHLTVLHSVCVCLCEYFIDRWSHYSTGACQCVCVHLLVTAGWIFDAALQHEHFSFPLVGAHALFWERN